jgi:hypothetical protein
MDKLPIIKAWQVWKGAPVSGLGQGQMLAAEVTGFGAVHFAKAATGETIVHGSCGIGRPYRPGVGANAPGTTDTTLMNMGVAVESLANPCDLSQASATVKAFQTAWNNTSDSNMGSPQLAVDGKYGPLTASAVGQATGDSVVAGCSTYTNGPQPAPQPQPQPQPQPTPPAPTPPSSGGKSMWPWILGGAGVLAAGGVAYAVLKKPSSGEMKGRAQLHARRAQTHQLHATRYRQLAREASASGH